MPRGEHRVQLASTEQFQPVSARLVSTRSQRPPGPTTVRSLRTVEDRATMQELRVGSGPASVLSTTRNFNAGWRATLDGKTLSTIRVDGWAQGWRLPEGDGGRLVISYGPQAGYLVLLLGGLLLAGIALVLALVLLLRTRLSPLVPVPVDGLHPWPERLDRRRWGLWTAAFVVGGWVFAGVPAVLGVLLGALAGRPTWARWLGIGLMMAAVALTAAQLVPGPRLRFDVADLLMGAGFFAALMSLFPRPGRRRP
jgi:arabinofuranan 3-O-arabinosyltransferase